MYLIGTEKIKTGNLDSGEYDEININIAITPADEPTIDIFNSVKTGNKLYANRNATPPKIIPIKKVLIINFLSKRFNIILPK